MSEKILVRAPNWLGDCVMSTVFLQKLVQKNVGASVSVLCQNSVASVFRGLSFVNEVVTFDNLNGSTWDTAYILPNSFSSALKIWRLAVPRRIGYAGDWRSAFLTEAKVLDNRWHYVRRYLGLLDEQAMDIHDTRPTLSPPLDHSIASTLPKSSGPRVAMAVGSVAPARRWFPQRFAEIARRIQQDKKGQIVLLGSASDVPVADIVARQIGSGVVNFTGKTSLEQLKSVLSQSDLVVTNESGVMHVAWALNKPTVIIAGPSEPRLTSPWGSNIRLLQARELFCVPCVRNTCWRGGPEHQQCMFQVEVEEVWSVVDDLLTSKKG